MSDDVLREVRAARDSYCRQFHYDLDAIVQDLQRQQQEGGREVVRLPRRRPASKTRDATAASAD